MLEHVTDRAERLAIGQGVCLRNLKRRRRINRNLFHGNGGGIPKQLAKVQGGLLLHDLALGDRNAEEPALQTTVVSKDVPFRRIGASIVCRSLDDVALILRGEKIQGGQGGIRAGRGRDKLRPSGGQESHEKSGSKNEGGVSGDHKKSLARGGVPVEREQRARSGNAAIFGKTGRGKFASRMISQVTRAGAKLT